ncbi:MAG TPA: sugar-binding protein [Phycisphaerae bacterium]|nr:sugar-binding protein [Phycisphaerae bacterium]
MLHVQSGRLREPSMGWWLYDGVTPPTRAGFGWVRAAGTNLRVVRTTIADNVAGGIRHAEPAHEEPARGWSCTYGMMMRGVVVTGNRGAGVSYDSASSAAMLMIQVNDVWGNAGGDWAGGASPGGSCRSADPLFRDSRNPDLDKRDYSLKPGSPCIASADYRVNWMGEGRHERGDLAGTPGPHRWGDRDICGDRCDMGAYLYVPRDGEPEAVRRGRPTLACHEVYVDRDWPGPYKGTAEAPFRSITDAVNAVEPVRGPWAVYNIRIAEGVYDRSIEAFGDFGIDLSYQVVNLFGGYAGWQGGDRFDWKTRKPRSTIVDPQGKSRAFVTNPEAITQHRFDGLTIRNGRVAGDGGAVCVQGLGGEAAMVAFHDCLFEDNECTGDGGAIWARTGDFPVYVTDCDFVNNQARDSGGAVLWETWEESLPLLLRDCRFVGNRAGADGGAVMIANCERGALLENCVFERNVAEGVGGAFCQRVQQWGDHLPPVIFRRCRLLDNDASDGGAVYVDRSLLTVLQGCVVARNGGEYAVHCRSLPEGLPEVHRRRISAWRRANPLWEGHRLQRPMLPAVCVEFCTVADNTGGGVCYTDTNEKPVNADTPGIGVTDSVFAANGGPAIADRSRKGNTRTGTAAWSLFHGNAKDVQGSVVLDVGCVQADPLLDDDYRLRKGSPAMGSGGEARSYTDAGGQTASVHPGYQMGAFGLLRERPDAKGSWKRAEHVLYVDANAKKQGAGTATSPFASLAEAVQAINARERLHRWADRYVVRVAEGTYRAGVDEKAKPVDFPVDAEQPPEGLGEGLLIEKGRVSFVGSYARRNGAPDWKARGKRTTVIDGKGRSRGIAAAPSYDVGLSFDGFVFRNCASLRGGGAIRLYGGIEFLGGVGRAELALTDCLFEDNRCWFAGGAVHAGGNCLKFSAQDCDFRRNQAGEGGALFLVTPCYGTGLEKDVAIRRCDFDRNRAAGAGGAVFTTCSRADQVLEDTTFRFNVAGPGNLKAGWTLEIRGGGGVFLLFYPALPANGNDADLVPWPFWYQTSFSAHHLMQRTEIMTFRRCRFYGNEGAAGMVVQAQPAFSQSERVISWMPSWVFQDCRVDKRAWGDFSSRAHRRPGTEPFDPPEVLAELRDHLRTAKDADEKRWCLDRLARVGKLEVVELVAPFLDDPEAKQAAAAAAVRIASACDVVLAAEDRKAATKAALAKAVGIMDDETLRTGAQILLVSLARPPAVAVRAAQPPKIDGKLDDAVWKQAQPLSDFRVARSVEGSKFPTEVRWAYDDKHLYAAIRCLEPELNKLVLAAKQRDDDAWRDDSVEVFLDTHLDRKTAYQYVFNANAVVLDTAPQAAEKGWDGPCEAKSGRQKDAWTLEAAIPWKSLGMPPPRPGQRIGLNVCRNRIATAKELSRWVDTGIMNYAPARFGVLVLE